MAARVTRELYPGIFEITQLAMYGGIELFLKMFTLTAKNWKQVSYTLQPRSQGPLLPVSLAPGDGKERTLGTRLLLIYLLESAANYYQHLNT